jgi:hypothetical protein
MIQSEGRRFAERSVAENPSPTEKEIAGAEKVLGHFNPGTRPVDFSAAKRPPLAFTMISGMVLMYVIVPSLIAALLFRGGLVLRVANVTFVRRDGVRASRLRIFWRALVAWSWFLPAVVIYAVLYKTSHAAGVIIVLIFVGLLVVWSVMLPRRGLPDRLAGTWPVPR